jgi:hypothetical protein
VILHKAQDLEVPVERLVSDGSKLGRLKQELDHGMITASIGMVPEKNRAVRAYHSEHASRIACCRQMRSRLASGHGRESTVITE